MMMNLSMRTMTYTNRFKALSQFLLKSGNQDSGTGLPNEILCQLQQWLKEKVKVKLKPLMLEEQQIVPESSDKAVVPDVTGQSAAVGENPMNILESQLEFKLSFPEFSGEAEMKEYAPDYFDDLGETFEALSRPASPASHVSPNDDEIDDTEVDELAGFNLPPPEHIASFAVDPAFPEAEVTIDTQSGTLQFDPVTLPN
ncbi:unnamed protein product [Notodromas monacha]|uniref:Uncharacterized protein n=1 Tax=Notodromas monacha TaxID=399045 RepID=A0A7R9GK03_9CRUS|nr:unnamed protein product [Notodromas monacha]CAG0925395.1 unnamed protein product [Notodromas monacha]